MELFPFSDDTEERLEAAGLAVADVRNVVEMTVTEDLAGGVDITSVATIPERQRSAASFGARTAGTLAGLDVAIAVVESVCGAADVSVTRCAHDGDRVAAGEIIARVVAPTRQLLTAERSALNLLCHLSGVATATRQWVDAVEGSGASIRDTRKTTPGLRGLEKYAVRCGGGRNHRMSLSDAALVKDNHIVAAGGIVAAFEAVRRVAPSIAIEVEVDSLDQLRAVIAAGAEVVLLDNMPTAVMREAVQIVADLAAMDNDDGRSVLLEASGGLTLDRARDVAATGVDYISVGRITHSAPILDIGLDLEGVVTD